MDTLEATVRRFTEPVNGQFPRPWMTSMTHPEKARIFIVGYNQAKDFCADRVGSHDAYIDALFNRNDRSCRKLYGQLSGEKGPSRTRKNIDRVSESLAREHLIDVIETNVICYSTPMSRDLALPKNQGGKVAGSQLFEEILAIIRPEVLIAHGVQTTKALGGVLSVKLPAAASDQANKVTCVRIHTALRGASYEPAVFVIPSLAPPAWNCWTKWAESHIAEMCVRVREFLENGQRDATA
jgi:hypothetical protein